MKRSLLFILSFVFVVAANSQTTVTYTQQTSDYYTTFSSGSAGIYNSTSYQIGMYANTSGSKQEVAWRKFRTDASGSTTSDRAMQVGDSLVVKLSATQAYGKIGFALLCSPTSTTSWADRENNYALSVNLDGPAYTGSGYGKWYIKYNGGSPQVLQVLVALHHTRTLSLQ